MPGHGRCGSMPHGPVDPARDAPSGTSGAPDAEPACGSGTTTAPGLGGRIRGSEATGVWAPDHDRLRSRGQCSLVSTRTRAPDSRPVMKGALRDDGHKGASHMLPAFVPCGGTRLLLKLAPCR